MFYDSALDTSPDATTWSQVSRLPNGVFSAAHYGANMWVGVNMNESIVTHP